MHRLRFSALLVLIAALCLHLLSGCSTGIRPAAPVPDSELLNQAQQLESGADYQGAAALFLDAAGRADSPLKEEYQLRAADSLLRGADNAGAMTVLDGIAPGALGEPQRRHYAVIQAQLALDMQQTERVLEILQDVPADGPYRADYRRLRAAAWRLNGNYPASAHEYIARYPLLADPAQQLENQLATWEVLNGLSDAELQQLRTQPPPDVFSGWLELVELTRLYLQQPDALAGVIPHWQMRYPGHPASDAFIAELLANLRTVGQPPEQVALLLPLSGTLAGAADAVRDGLLAAYYDASDGINRPLIRIYDTGADPLAIIDVYQQAVADGARFVIGPLRKEAVEVLTQQEQLPVAVLALNQVDNAAPYNPALYQFGLAPEDEAREVAQRAMRDGHLQAIALVPAGDWGERVYAAFADEWLTLGGVLLDQQTYDSAETDHGQAISTTLNLDTSKTRKLRLGRLLGQPLEFEPRRRQDVDFIFLLATPVQARLIRPQLSFYRASKVPVYSTSHVYSARPDPARDTDMNGLVFCDMPWTLETTGSWQHLHQAIADHWPAEAARYSRFHALGIDAWRITPYLSQLGGSMFGAYHGVTGNLSLDGQQRVHRTLRWAQIRNGLPYLLEAGGAGDTPTDSAIPPR